MLKSTNRLDKTLFYWAAGVTALVCGSIAIMMGQEIRRQILAAQQQEVTRIESARKQELINDAQKGDIVTLMNGNMCVVFGERGTMSKCSFSGEEVDLSFVPETVYEVTKYGTPKWRRLTVWFVENELKRN